MKFGDKEGSKLEVCSLNENKTMIICLDDDGTPFFEIDGIRWNVSISLHQ